jgi:hypothetical protein
MAYGCARSTPDGTAEHGASLASTSGAHGRASRTTQSATHHCTLFFAHALANGRARCSASTSAQQRGPVIGMGSKHQGQQAEASQCGTQYFGGKRGEGHANGWAEARTAKRGGLCIYNAVSVPKMTSLTSLYTCSNYLRFA